MAIGNKIRFDVFKRDGFTCQYCGGHPPERVLEADHILPKSKGGKDDINNLITACFECNRGKRNHELTTIPSPLSNHISLINEKEKQYALYRKLLVKIEKRTNDAINDVECVYRSKFHDWSFGPTFRTASVKQFISKLDLPTVKEAMAIAVSKGKSADDTLKYFCGICWTKIREKNG